MSKTNNVVIAMAILEVKRGHSIQEAAEHFGLNPEEVERQLIKIRS